MSAHESASTIVGMPLAVFVRLFEQEGPFELVDGERIPVLPGVAEHSEIIMLIYEALLTYKQQTGRIVTYAETAYVLHYSSDWVTGARIPDVMAYESSRMAEYKAQTPDWRQKPFVLVPDLCVEVVSPNDIYAEVDEKVARYLSDGVRLVWVVNLRTGSVQAHTGDSIQSTRLTQQHTLGDSDILPGFELAISDIFTD